MKRLFALLMLGAIVILPFWTQAEDRQWFFPTGGSWQPSEQVIQEINATIESQVKDLAKQAGGELMPWGSYSFQLQGQDLNGKQYVLVNALCGQRDPARLASSLIIVFDGGSCFFNVKYDPVHKVFYDLLINGVA